jgi:hypothetical protein
MTPTSLQRRQEAREQLERAVEALAQSEGWAAWIRTRSAFRQYSLSNQFLIAMQCPDATPRRRFQGVAEVGTPSAER